MQVNLDPNKPPRRRKAGAVVETAVEFIVPGCVLLLIGLFTYAFAYRLMWQRVFPVHKAAAIGIIAAFGALLVYTLLQLALIHLYGCGSVHPGYVQSADDDPFMCSSEGFAFYCSECQMVKPNRTSHSTKVGRCVPVMDHFCVWIGAVIGQGNRKFFVLFSLGLAVAFVYVLVCLLIFQHNAFPDTMALSIVLYILCGFLGSFTVAVALNHVWMVILAQTTISNMRWSAKSDHFVNFPTKDSRRIVNISQKKLGVAAMFDEGMWRNWCTVMGPPWMWLLPLRPAYVEPVFRADRIAAFQRESD